MDDATLRTALWIIQEERHCAPRWRSGVRMPGGVPACDAADCILGRAGPPLGMMPPAVPPAPAGSCSGRHDSWSLFPARHGELVSPSHAAALAPASYSHGAPMPS